MNRINNHPRLVYAKLRQEPCAAITGMNLKLFTLKPQLIDHDLKVNLKVHSGSSTNSLQFLCQYDLTWAEQESYDAVTLYSLPPTYNALWFCIEICYEAKGDMNKGLIDIKDLCFFQQETNVPSRINEFLLTRKEAASRGINYWRDHHKLKLEYSEHLDWEKFCLPVKFSDKPLIFFDRRLTVSLGDLQQKQLPNL